MKEEYYLFLESVEVLKAMSDLTRFRILFYLSNNERVTNKELSENLNMTKSAISHQLRILKNKNLIIYKKEGKNVYYNLKDIHIKEILKTTLEHVKEYL